jgi:tRNA 2-thiouridine synthesizing protein A
LTNPQLITIDLGKKVPCLKARFAMTARELDTLGLKCPQPVLKIAVVAGEMKKGEVLEILGDCPTFEKDVRTWCNRLGKTFVAIKDEGKGKKRIQVRF